MKMEEAFATWGWLNGIEVEDMVKHYDWAHPDINSRSFVMKFCERPIFLELLGLERVASTRNVEDFLNRCGLRHATIGEILAFGAVKPDVQRRQPVVALGDFWPFSTGWRRYPYLGGDALTRFVSLTPAISVDNAVGGVWPAEVAFLTVRR